MAEIVEELVAEALALVSAWHETSDIEEFNGYTALAILAGAVVGLATVGNIVALACAFDLQVANGALRVYGGESIARQDNTVSRGGSMVRTTEDRE